jgi:hypothetical protein
MLILSQVHYWDSHIRTYPATDRKIALCSPGLQT